MYCTIILDQTDIRYFITRRYKPTASISLINADQLILNKYSIERSPLQIGKDPWPLATLANILHVGPGCFAARLAALASIHGFN